MLYHKGLTLHHWQQFSLCEQLANVGAEVGRAIAWRERGDMDKSQRAFERALELLSLTMDDTRHHNHRLNELVRVYEVLVDYFAGDNEYGSTDQRWLSYFNGYNHAAAMEREKPTPGVCQVDT